MCNQETRKFSRQENAKRDRRLDIRKLEDAGTFAERLWFFRKRVKLWTQENLEQKSGVGAAQISRYETNQQAPQGPTVKLLAEALEVSIDDLVGIQALPSKKAKSSEFKPTNSQAPVGQQEILEFENRIDAYEHLARLICERRRVKVDLLQFSGYTSLPVLKAIAKTSPDAKVRLLLCDPGVTRNYDSDHEPDHKARMIAATDAIPLMKTNDNKKFKVKIYYYRTPPSVSSIIIDDTLVSLSWYYSYLMPSTKIVRMRGHDSATLVFRADLSTTLYGFARRHFDQMIKSAVPIANVKK